MSRYNTWLFICCVDVLSEFVFGATDFSCLVTTAAYVDVNNVIFQQDGATCHTALVTITWFYKARLCGEVT